MNTEPATDTGAMGGGEKGKCTHETIICVSRTTEQFGVVLVAVARGEGKGRGKRSMSLQTYKSFRFTMKNLVGHSWPISHEEGGKRRNGLETVFFVRFLTLSSCVFCLFGFFLCAGDMSGSKYLFRDFPNF